MAESEEMKMDLDLGLEGLPFPQHQDLLLFPPKQKSNTKKTLKLEDRVSVIQRKSSGETTRKIATSLGVGVTQIKNIMKNKEDILKRWEWKTGELLVTAEPEKKETDLDKNPSISLSDQDLDLDLPITQQPLIKKCKPFVRLNLEERVSVVKRKTSGESTRKIATSLGVGVTQIKNIMKNKEDILRRWESGECRDRKQKLRHCPYSDLNERVWEWYCEAKLRNLPVTGKFVQQQAAVISTELGYNGKFQASNGWLESWRKRYNVNFKVVRGDIISKEISEDWSKRLTDICNGYSLADIFNADETGLRFRSLPTASSKKKGDQPIEDQGTKSHITALVAVSGTGEKLDPLIIGKKERPQCFQGYNLKQLGVDYYFNKRAMMTSDIFKDWILRVNNKMRLQERKILMFVVNCPTHPQIELSNVRLFMITPNTMLRVQPCQAGIIEALKLDYRKQQLRHILCLMDGMYTAAQLAPSISLLHAVMWWKMAYEKLQPQTIIKAFAKCGFNEATDYIEVIGESTTVEPEELYTELLPKGVNMTDFAASDNGLQTRQEEGNGQEEEEQDWDDGENGVTPQDPSEMLTHQGALSYIQELTNYALRNGVNLLNLQAFQRDIEDLLLSTKNNQSSAVSLPVVPVNDFSDYL